MDSKFIELHEIGKRRELISLNVKNICEFNSFISNDGKEMTAIGMNDGSLHVVNKTYDEVKQMIKDSGIHIQKADPRLDTSHPLTMADLREMIGEPVWNSNLNVWLLVKACSDLYVDLVWTSGNVSAWDADEIQKFPLYRIKQ